MPWHPESTTAAYASPKYRPFERFWPYAELPEQPTDEELAALDPDLHEALFGAQPRPFSITLVFPRSTCRTSRRRWRWRGRPPSTARPAPATTFRHRARFCRAMRSLRDLFEIVGRSDATDVLIDDRPVPTRASCGCR